MARVGINKAVVQKARQALLARGLNPSIDAVRIELGNTGSKTTIHRYLKELNSQLPVQRASAPTLSDALTTLVEQLAEQIREEGEARIEQARSAFEAERQTLLAHNASPEQREQEQRRHEGQAQLLQVELRQLQQTLIVKQDELTRLNRDNEGLLVQIRTLKDAQRTFKTQGERRQAQIQGLEVNLAQLEGSRTELEKQNQNLALSLAERVTELRQQLQLIGKLEAQLNQAEKTIERLRLLEG
ncbi:DNA-binding protein [Pseudomonas alkylphenolica]|uniref:DNA-binding protein n=1 Tax=Pseudomonas alkylphenolica TaxID=237609 RepID=UPI0033928FEC